MTTKQVPVAVCVDCGGGYVKTCNRAQRCPDCRPRHNLEVHRADNLNQYMRRKLVALCGDWYCGRRDD